MSKQTVTVPRATAQPAIRRHWRPMQGVVRTAAFIGKELSEIRRQPRLIASLGLGPFLILLLFGLGYTSRINDIRTLIVLPANLQQSVDVANYQDIFTKPFVLVGVTTDLAAAQQQVANRQVEAVIAVPPDAYDTILRGEHAQLQIIYSEIDPLTVQWIQFYSYVQTNELNKRILLQALRQQYDQSRLPAIKESAGSLRGEAGALRSSVGANDRVGTTGHLAMVTERTAQLRSLLLPEAQLLGGVALATNVKDPQNTPQGKALLDAQQALDQIDSDAAQLRASAQQGNFSQDDQRRAEAIERNTATVEEAAGQLALIPPEIVVAPFTSAAHSIAKLEPDFVTYYAPAVMALLIQHIAVTLTALTLVRERLIGAVELFRVAPTRGWEITLGKFIGYLLLTSVLAAGLAAVMHFGLGVPILGGYITLAIALGLLIVASLSLGFFISAISQSESQAVQFSMLLLLASVFFSGFFISLNSFTPYVRVVSYLLPVTYGIKALQSVMLRGEQPAWWVLTVLASGAALGFLASTLIFRRQLRRG